MRRILLRLATIGSALTAALAASRAEASPDELPGQIDGGWAIRSASGPGSASALAAESLRVRFSSSETGFRVGVSGGCNGMGGAGSLHGDNVVFGPIMSTMMACAPPLMEADDFVSKVLEGPARLELRGDTLVLQTGARRLELAREPEADEPVAEPA